MHVEELMTRKLFTCDTRDNLARAAQIMWEHDCGCVPIVNGQGKVMGVVTDRDVTMAAYTQGKRLADIPLSDVMSHHVHVCAPDVSIQLAHEIMRQADIRRLPVVDETGALMGLISLSDIILASQQEPSERDRRKGTREVLETLDAISAHHL
ncbi:MAG: CBS domain-containing protein [Polyangiales bacterium]